MSSIFTKSFQYLLKAIGKQRGGSYIHREYAGTFTDKKGKIRNKWHYFRNQGTLQKELAEWKARFEAKQAKQKRNLFATPADIKEVEEINTELNNLEIKIKKLSSSDNDPMREHFTHGVGFRSDTKRFNSQIDSSLDNAVKLSPLLERQRELLKRKTYIESGEKAKKDAENLKIRSDRNIEIDTIREQKINSRLEYAKQIIQTLKQGEKVKSLSGYIYTIDKITKNNIITKEGKTKPFSDFFGIENAEAIKRVLATPADIKGVETDITKHALIAPLVEKLKVSDDPSWTIRNYIGDLAGDRNKSTRTELMSFLTGVKTPSSKSGVNALTEIIEKKLESHPETKEALNRGKVADALRQEKYAKEKIESANLEKKISYLQAKYPNIPFKRYGYFPDLIEKNGYKYVGDGVERSESVKNDTALHAFYIKRLKEQLQENNANLSNKKNTLEYKKAVSKKESLDAKLQAAINQKVIDPRYIPSFNKLQENNFDTMPKELPKQTSVATPKLNNAREFLDGRFITNVKDLNEFISKYGVSSDNYISNGSLDKSTQMEHVVEFAANENLKRADISSIQNKLTQFKKKLEENQKKSYDRSKIGRDRGHSAGAFNRDMEGIRVAGESIKGEIARLEKEIKRRESITPQPTSSQSEPVQAVSFDEHLASITLTPKQLEVSKQVYNTVKDLPESELRLRLDRLSKLPASNGIAGITAINYVLGSKQEKPVENNFETMPDSKPQENNFETMPETKQEEKSAVPTGVKIESNGNSQVVKSSSVNPDTKEVVYTVENKDGIETKVPESKIKIIPVTQTTEVKKVIESAEPSNRMAIEKQLIGKPENAISIKDDIAEKSKAPVAYIEKEITTLAGIKIKAIDYSSVPHNEIQIIDAENILTTPKPSYIPEINERDFEIKSYFLEFVKAPDGNFIVPLNRYVPKVQRALERDAKGNIAYQNKAREQEPKYAIMSLENIVATTEYYRTKKLEEGRDKATKNNIANVEKILTWDQKTREYYKPFNYTRLSESQKKKYSEESWNKLSETEKLKEVPKMKNPPIHINPIPRLKIGLKDMKMLVSTFHLYKELVDDKYSIPSRGEGYNPKDQVAIDFNSIREDYTQKVEDMKIQKEEDSASYKQALETSFGMSKTKNDLFESHGILVKSQNGKEVNRDQVKDISEAMNLVYSVFGDKKQLSQSANLKISHSGEKYIFASKALGMYVRSMGTIAISNKDSKVNKGFTLAHEFAHFMDNWLGKKNKRNFASDDYNSVAGKIAKTFREKMENLDIATGYHKRTCECFARALEQYFAIKTGNDSEYSNQKYYIKDTKYFEETFSPMIEKFLSENEHLLKAFPLFTERKSNILTLLKGKKAQEGEVRTWGNGKQFKKVGGKWQPVAGGKKKAAPKEKKERKKKGSAESNTGFSMKPFAEIKRIAQYTKEADFDKEKIEQYKNSIAEHGYDPAFPMVIDKDKKTGAYNVVAGNHRYKAVESLIAEGKLPKDFEIPTVMREFEDENARLAYQVRENQRRDPLPTDEANAYKKMADNGWDAARIAKELGLSVGKVSKRLALSNLSPDLFNLVSKKGIPVGIAEAIGLGSVEEESGKPNHTIQLKAYQFYRDNKGKGYGAGEVLSFIRELKSNASQKFFENDGKSDTEKEALRSVGSEEKAKRNVKMLDNTFKTMQKALSQLMGDSVGQINPKLAKELSASIVAAQGESEFSNKMKMLDTVIQDMTLMKEAFMKSFKGMKDDSTMGMMFASSINTMIHSVNKHTKAIETAKAINKMLSMAYKTKYKLHDQSVKARLAA